MTIRELETRFGMQTLQAEYEDRGLSGGYTSDLLSDVMANAAEGMALITIQSHTNTVAVAAMTGIVALVICNNRPVPDEMVQAAKEEGIAVFLTGEDQFTVSGKLYAALQQGAPEA